MSADKFHMTLDMLQAVAAVSHLLPWREFRVYSLILSRIDQGTSSARMNQTEIANATGYSPRAIKYYLAELENLGLVQKWRGPHGANYYRVSFPLTGKVVEKISDRIPEYGVEPKCRPRKEPQTEAIATATVNEEELSVQQIPEESVADTVQPDPSSSQPALDPEISSLLDAIEKGTVRNSVCRFLEYLGVVEPQLAMDQEIVVDRESLSAYLIEHDANSIDKFGELHQFFSESPQQLPYIDVPKSFPLPLHLHHKLDLHPCGLQWLRKMVQMRNGDGIRLTDREIRQNLFDFMKENGLKTFDEVVKRCKSKHDEIVSAKRNHSYSYVTPEQFGLGQYIH